MNTMVLCAFEQDGRPGFFNVWRYDGKQTRCVEFGVRANNKRQAEATAYNKIISVDTDTPCGNPNCDQINVGIDACIKPVVDALNSAGLETVASCCGHGKAPTIISLKDGRQVVIYRDYEEAINQPGGGE